MAEMRILRVGTRKTLFAPHEHNEFRFLFLRVYNSRGAKLSWTRCRLHRKTDVRVTSLLSRPCIAALTLSPSFLTN